jgi:thioredoxin reductase (NADPH)
MTNEVELLIIGGGAAGLAAGLYSARARLDAVLIERMGAGGQLINVDRVENYPGFPDGIAGYELGPLFSQQALDAGLRMEYGEVLRIGPFGTGERHLVETDGDAFAARAVIVACGSTLARLGVPGEAELEGHGVSYCATCDGDFCRDQPVAVVGGGDSAIDEALYLTEIASHVTVVHRRGSFRAEQLGQQRLLDKTNVSVVWNTEPVEITGQQAVDGVRLRSVKDNTTSRLDVAGVFIYTGLRPNTGFLQGVVALDPAGHVITDQRLESSVKGIFAAGDLRQFSVRQVAASAGDGVTAAIWAERYLRGPLAR